MNQPSSGGPSPYAKPWLDYPDQVALLIKRGLTVGDKAAAEKFLAHVNYYRFSGYCLAFEQARHSFIPGVTFGDVRQAYSFDTALRDLLTEALEVIEIDVRAAIAFNFGRDYGPFGHSKPANFFHAFDHAALMDQFRDEAKRSKEVFVDHCRQAYPEYPDLPVWILTEVVPFGVLTRFFRGLLRADQQKVSSRYRLQAATFGAIMLHLVYVRNVCAHHSRLWDRLWSIKPTLPKGVLWLPPLILGNDRLFATLCLTQHLLKSCLSVGSFASEWRDRLHALLATPPNTSTALARMGMPPKWKEHPIWM